jgi:FkbM family methyltransferase
MSVFGHKVIAIEPMYSNVKLMEASLQASQASQNVIVHPHALGMTSGQCILYSDDSNVGDGHTICGISAQRGMDSQVPAGYSVRQVIHVTRLDVLVDQDIDVMKIDVEGYELFAVRSGDRLFDRHHVHHIISEFCPSFIRAKNSDPYEYLKFFISRGYDIRVLTDNIGDAYERNTWQAMPIYRSEQDLRKLSNESGLLDIWFMKN